jgi:hypothetical protein
MSVLILPEPANWSAGHLPLRKLTLVVAVLAAAGICTGTRQIILGRHLEAFFALAFVVPFLLPLLGIYFFTRRDTSLRASRDATGTMLRPDRTLTWVMMTTIGLYIPLGLAVVVLTLSGELHLFPTRRGQAGLVVTGALLVMTAVTGFVTAWRRGGIGYVKLTPSGIDIADIKRTETVGWDDILAVDDHSDSNKKIHRAIVIKSRDGSERPIGNADLYVPKGVGLYWMVRHYWRQVEDRDELTDGRALERLWDGRFDLT